jgi:SAM-dependent methyltransferase
VTGGSRLILMVNQGILFFMENIRDKDSNAYYENYFRELTSTGAMGLFHKWMHRSIERGIGKQQYFERILELGAGQNRHMDSVIHKYSEYHLVDIRYKLLLDSILENSGEYKSIQISQKHAEFQKTQSPNAGARIFVSDENANQLGRYPNDYFDRVFSTCLIMHLEDPEQALSEWRRILRNNGRLSIYVHSEPGLLLRFARYVGLRGKAKRRGFDHIRFVYLEHRYSFLFLKYLIADVFSEDEIVWDSYPVPLLSWNFSFWKVARIRVVKPSVTLI